MSSRHTTAPATPAEAALEVRRILRQRSSPRHSSGAISDPKRKQRSDVQRTRLEAALYYLERLTEQAA